jgi:type I restriction enzyme, S subunit
VIERPLGELLEVLIDHRGKTPKKLGGDFVSVGIPVASAVNVKAGRLLFEGAPRCVTAEMFERWMPVRLRAGDVLLTSEAPLGEVARVVSDEPLVLGQRLFGLRGRPDALDSGYLYYALQWRPIQDRLLARSTGTTVHGIRQSELVRVSMPVPPLVQQRRIAAVLGALDDKVTVNLQLHRLSWNLAAALYRQLIVQSNREVSLGDAIELAYGKALPAKARVEGAVPVYGSGGVVGRHDVALVHGPGVVIGRKGTAGAVHWSHSPFYPIDTTFYVKSVHDLPMLFIYFALKSLDLESMNFDSAVPGLNRNAALAREIPLPEAPALESFAETTTPLIDRAASALYENELLARLRDVLLPRLLSGELRIREAEAAVGEAM